MGISANQARLLALTARKCDLETQMQIILNNKLNIAKNTSSVANTYDDAISNRRLFIFKPTSNQPLVDGTASQDNIYKDLDTSNLYNTGGLLVAQKVGNTYSQVTGTQSPALIEKNLREGIYFLVTPATLQTQDPKPITFVDGAYAGGATSLRTDTTAQKTWEIVDWRSSTKILDQLDKSDDETAQQNYERVMNELKVKESKLDVEMNSIETSHSAITNEIESVKKIMTKNTEDSFKYFS